MSRSIKFDLRRFSLLTPKAFALPDDQADEKEKRNFLAGSGTPVGIYGKGAKLEYDYAGSHRSFVAQFEQLVTAYRQLGQELKPRLDLQRIDGIIDIINGQSGYRDISEEEKPTAYRIFKLQMESVLFYMRAALTQAQAAGDAESLIVIHKKIAATLTKFNEGFTRCIQLATESLMSEQVNWTPNTGIAQCLLRHRTNLVDLVALESNPNHVNVHRTTDTFSIAAEQGYGVIAPKHRDPEGADDYWEDEAPEALFLKFFGSYTYEAICADIHQEFLSKYRHALKNYSDAKSLNKDQQDTLRDRMKELLSSGICQEVDLFETIRTDDSETICINPTFAARLPEYCARYTVFILEKEGYVTDIGYLPWFRSGRSYSLDACIQTYPLGSSFPIDQWYVSDSKDGPLLTEKFNAGDFFTVLNLLTKKTLFSPFYYNLQRICLFDLVLRLDSTDWRRPILLRHIIQHPLARWDRLTRGRQGARQLDTFNYLTLQGSNEIFILYWDRILGHPETDFVKLAELLNAKDQYGKSAIVYAFASDDWAKIQKLMMIPGVDLRECLSFVKKDTEQGAKMAALISCCNAIESKQFVEATVAFAAYRGGREADYRPFFKLLKQRYGDAGYPHHADYQGFLQHFSAHEKDLQGLLMLKQEDPTIDLNQPRLLRLQTGDEVTDTPLRAAIRDGDEEMVTRLFEEAKVDPDIDVAQENPWPLVASKTLGLLVEQQQALLDLLLDHTVKGKTLRWATQIFLLELFVAPECADAAFNHILGQIIKEKEQEYYGELGEYELGRREFIAEAKQASEIAPKELDAPRVRLQILLGKNQEAKNADETRIVITQRLRALLDKVQEGGGDHSILYRVVATYQPEKVMGLLLVTANLDFQSVFTIPGLLDAEGEKSMPASAILSSPTDRAFVKNLMRLLHTLRQKSPDYKVAQQCFADLYATQKNPQHYQKLLTVILNQCSKGKAFELFKQLAAQEQQVACLQLLNKYVPIDFLKTVHYAAHSSISVKQFKEIWQEAVASIADLSQADSLLNLKSLVRALAGQPEKLSIVLAEFPIMSYLVIDRGRVENGLIRLCHTLEQGHLDLAVTYYLLDQQQPVTADLKVIEPIATVINSQFGAVMLKKFSQRLQAQCLAPTSLVKIQQLITAQQAQQAVLLFLRQVESTEGVQVGTLLSNLQMVLSLHRVINSSLVNFCRILLSHCASDSHLQFSIILHLMPLDIKAAAQLFCAACLAMKDGLIPEKLMLEQFAALQSAQAKLSSGASSLQEFFSCVMERLVSHHDFSGYDTLCSRFSPQRVTASAALHVTNKPDPFNPAQKGDDPSKFSRSMASFYIESTQGLASILKKTGVLTKQLSVDLLQRLGKHLLARNDVEGVISLLKQAQSDASCIMDPVTGDTVATFAVQQGWLDLIKWLAQKTDPRAFAIRNDRRKSPLELAIAQGTADTTMATTLLDAKVELGLWPVFSDTDSALILAVKRGDLPLCQKIVERAQQDCKTAINLSAFLNHKNVAGKSALYLTVELQQETLVSWLLSLPGIDKEAYCATTFRTAALCSYQQTQQVRQLQQLPSVPTEVASDAKAVASVTEVVPASSSSLPERILQQFAEQKVIDPSTAEIKHQLANVAQHLNRGQQDRAVQELLALLTQHGCTQSNAWLKALPPLSQAGAADAFVVQVGIAAMRLAVTDPKHLSLVKNIIVNAAIALPLLKQMLSGTPILFSQLTLDTLRKPGPLQCLWPAAVSAYALACRNRPQCLPNQPVMEKIVADLATFPILEFPAADQAEMHNTIILAMRELYEAQQHHLARMDYDEAFLLSEPIRHHRNQMLQDHVSQGHVDQVRVLLDHFEMKSEAGQQNLYLIDVNISATKDKDLQGKDAKLRLRSIKPAEPSMVFTVLARAKQESDSKHETEKPFCTILKLLVDHPTWQDTSVDAEGQTLLMRAVTADSKIFATILAKTQMSTCLLSMRGCTAMDLARPCPPIAGETTAVGQNISKEERSKYLNAEVLATHLLREFDRCVEQIQQLKKDATAIIKDEYGTRLTLPMLRIQARILALELLKFDTLRVQRQLSSTTANRSSWLGSLSRPKPTAAQQLLGDIQRYQGALQLVQSIDTVELVERARQSSPFFIAHLTEAWLDILPIVSSTTPTADIPQPLPASDAGPTLLNFSKYW